MQKLTIGRMAKLYGLHRSTLYDAVSKGRISAGFDGKGQRVIELSEMIRVYGEPLNDARQNPTSPPDAYQTLADSELLSRFDALIEVVKEQRDELKALREEVHQLRRLPPPLATPIDKLEASQKQPTTSKPSDKSGGSVSFADIEKKLAKRLGR
jgi:excisionase family DNA binding protein|uniref:RepB n=1 Tax=Halomonas sp. Ant2 TaxID=1630300 RepID=A0A0D5MBG8_9GAMM|nr:hypothetical protein [Halomonas sp. Ant2]AJY53639.1 RepB [Halomonas sp. Ant2]|tara:strand:- start:3054 stop:3515 length:462 start_codon:yes stop_codon:yes gene_type:complete